MANPSGATLGQVVRARREALHLTQEDLAASLGDGVTQTYVSQLERGKVQLPRRERLERIASALKISTGELLSLSGWSNAVHHVVADTAAIHAHDAASVVRREVDPTLDLILADARRLTPAGRVALRKHALALAEMEAQIEEDMRRDEPVP